MKIPYTEAWLQIGTQIGTFHHLCGCQMRKLVHFNLLLPFLMGITDIGYTFPCSCSLADVFNN